MLDQVIVPDLWQQEAVGALNRGQDVIVHAPTGAGKTLIFELWANHGKPKGRAVYTVPTRALANDKLAEWRARDWYVGIATGDLSENLDASILTATLETQKNRLIHGDGPDLLVIDEYQMIGDMDRGLNYEVAIALAPPKTQLLLLSGSVANPDHVAKWLRRIGRDPVVIKHDVRPVPLEEVHPAELSYRVPKDIRGYWPSLVAKAMANDLGPLLIFVPRRSGTEKLAARIARYLPTPDPLKLTPEQRRLVSAPMARMLQSRIAYHHSGLAFGARAGVIEPLAKAGQLRVVVATMGLAAGINFSFRTCALAADSYNRGGREQMIRSDEILQMFGRAGRRGLDDTGYILLSTNEIGLRDAHPATLTRSGLVDWGALLGIMAAAADAGEEPFAAAVRVQERLFTTRPITLGIEFSMKHLGAPCGLKTDPERARYVSSKASEFLNSRGRWQPQPERTPVPLRSARVIAGHAREGEDAELMPALTVEAIARTFGKGTPTIVSPRGQELVEYGRAALVADRLKNGRLELSRWVRRLLNARGRVIKPEFWRNKLSSRFKHKLAERGTPVLRFVRLPGKLIAHLDLGDLSVNAIVDEAGVPLLKFSSREVANRDCSQCGLAPECRNLSKSTGTALTWRRMGLIDPDGVPTRRGRIVAFFTQGDGLAIAAALEDEGYPLEELIYDLANLKAGYRFAGDEYRWEGRLAFVCAQTYGRQTIVSYLEAGMPCEYGAGAEQIVKSVHANPACKHEWVGTVAEEGDIDRLIIEWRSLLRRVAHSPDLKWARWMELKENAANVLNETESPTLKDLPELDFSQKQRLDHRLDLRRH
jgi:superfamily II DNA/RNA helicase